MLETVKNYLLDLIFPPLCLGCQLEGSLLCGVCSKKLPVFNTIVCPQCHKKLPGTEPLLWKCSIHGAKSKLKFVAYSTLYDNQLAKKIIGTFKYKLVSQLAEIVSGPMVQNLNQFNFLNFTLVPVPLHKTKFRERGFNQASLLALEIARQTGMALAEVLIKNKKTKSHTALNFKERQNNVLGTFECKNPELIKNKNVLLVDDISTTGATLEECAKVLKQNGARYISALVVARG